jgi:NAD(P)-dependent dehydrogenase (short-subunit alcohol dehydrogenase family)
MPQVLITGANRGIGLEFARQYAAAGWDVIATARDLGDADELKGLDHIRVEQLELREIDAVARFGERIDTPLDLLVSNAGTWVPDKLDSAEDARAWAEMMVTNAIAPTLLAHRLADKVASAKGKMIAITSGMGSIADNDSGGYIPYRSSKAALNMAWHSLAIDYRDIIFAVLNPGWVKTRMGGPQAPTPPEKSVAAMRRVIESLQPKDSGGFFNHDGRPYPW